MQNADVYLSLLLGAIVFLTGVFSVILYRKAIGAPSKRPKRAPVCESFYCVRSNLKRINDNFYVAQILFTNRKDCTLTTQGEVRRQTTDE